MFLVLRRAVGSLVETAGTRDAAQVAFFFVMSFPAALLLLVWGFSTLLGDDSVRETIVDSIVDALPLDDSASRRQVEGLLDDVAAGSGSLGWLGALALLYSSSGAIGALRHTVNEAWEAPDRPPYVSGKLLDVGLTLLAGPVVFLALGLAISGALAESIGNQPWLVAAAQFAVTRLVPVLLLLGLLVALFRVLPASGANLRSAWPGALTGLVGALAIQGGLQAYFSLAGSVNAIYGTLGVLLAIVFSAYLLAVAIVLGAHVSAQVSRLPDEAALERALHADSTGVPVRRRALDGLRGLFVRSRAGRDG